MTPARVLELKREAAALRDSERIKLSAALARIAQREGFRSWVALITAAGGGQAVRDERWENPTESMVRHGERRADRLRRYGSGK